jgi:hypothetical protein
MSTTVSLVKQAKELTTPQLLRGSMFVTWGASLLFMTSAIAAVQAQRQAIKVVGLDSAPSILNAQRIQDSVANLDANLANELLVKAGENPDAVAGYEKRRNKLSRLLVAVAENITYGDDERIPIQTLQIKTLEYIQLIQQARNLHAMGNNAAMLEAYRKAAAIVDKDLLPAAVTLAQVNYDNLEKVYRKQRAMVSGAMFAVIVNGLLLLGILIGLQLFLYRRMQRVFNLGLLAASVITGLFLLYTIASLSSAANQLKVAREDAFDSLYAMRRARSLSYGANGDQNRYLLDPQSAAVHQKAFVEKINRIASLPSGMSISQVANRATASGEGSFRLDGFNGFLADELGNITFEGEKRANVETLQAFATYLNADQKMRDLQTSGNRAGAIALAVGNDPNGINKTFDQYLKAHQNVLDINTDEFKKAIERGFSAVELDVKFKKPDPNAAQKDNQDIYILNTENPVEVHSITRYEVIAASATGAIALLTLLGLMPRLKEYSR